ncbi:MAG: serine/threonine protein kinase, partial [Deltaproteobacteria bacterium]|nr:serine/threonine protein kinase [Deltaproteobacteria bacterium]
MNITDKRNDLEVIEEINFETIDSLIASELEPDVNLGEKFEVICTLGSGGMGRVYKVYHKIMGVERAIKLLDSNLSKKNSQVFERFKSEALISSEQSHPNIIKVFDLDKTPDGVPFILMEYLDGIDFEEVIRRHAPLPLDKVIKLLTGVSDALDTVHKKGIVHRDLKPANLFLTKKGKIKILDFGISTLASSDKSRITREGEVVGTPLYMSPEQITGEVVDSRADIYALGIIAYELL